MAEKLEERRNAAQNTDQEEDIRRKWLIMHATQRR